jgi:hypothetical protein
MSLSGSSPFTSLPCHRVQAAFADAEFEELVSEDVPEGIHRSDDVLHVTRMSALQEDIDDLVVAVSDLNLDKEAPVVRPELDNLLNPAPSSGRICEQLGVTPITTSGGKLELQAVVRLLTEHDFKSGVLTEQSFELKTQYAPVKLLDARARLGDSALGDSDDAHDANAEATRPSPRVITHRLRHAAGTLEAYQELMHRRRGGYSRNERWTVEKTGALSGSAISTLAPKPSGRLTVWSPAREILAALPEELRINGK